MQVCYRNICRMWPNGPKDCLCHNKELEHHKTNIMTLRLREDSDQPAYLASLIKVFAVHFMLIATCIVNKLYKGK